jgi:hypothetical protein
MSRVAAVAKLSALIVLSGVTTASSALAEDRAVSQPNGTAYLSFGGFGIQSTHGQSLLLGGEFFGPLGDSLGIGLGVAAGPAFGGGTTNGAVAADVGLFWRDPESGIVGVFGSVAYVAETTTWVAGLAGSVYIGDIDLGGSVGAAGASAFSISSATGVFGVDAGWFATEQLRLGLGIELTTDEVYGALAAMRWQPGPNTSPFSVELRGGGGSASGLGFYSVGAAVVIQFGDRKSLKQQLREDRL